MGQRKRLALNVKVNWLVHFYKFKAYLVFFSLSLGLAVMNNLIKNVAITSTNTITPKLSRPVNDPNKSLYMVNLQKFMFLITDFTHYLRC